VPTSTATKQAILPWADPEYINNPYPWYALARRDFPVFQDLDGSFVITRYEDVVKYGKLASLSIVDPEWVPKGAWAALSTTVLGLDPPAHTKARRRSNKWFTPKFVSAWVQHAEASAREQLAGVAEGEIFDANMVLGVGPCHRAMCAALDFPADEFEPVIFAMHQTMVALSTVAGKEQQARAEAAFDYLLERVRRMIADKRANPGNGMADALIGFTRDGELSEQELEQVLTLFWASGGHNPSFIISSAIEYCARHPDVWDIYRAEPEKRANFINEIFRLNPPELFLTRYASEPMDIRGQPIRPGERMKFIIDAANRDPEVFPEPDVLDMGRPQQAAMHISFGVGVHQCAGQVISRAEVEAVLGVLADEVERFILQSDPEMDRTDRSRAYVRLPVSIIRASAR